jgi:succinoglycan biosynthesis transport protein ExoP
VDLRDYARTLRKHWQLVALCTLLGVAAAAGATLAATSLYKATTQLFVSVQAGQNDLSQLYQGNTFSQQRVKSYADIVDSPRVTEPVIRELRLPLTPDQLAGKIHAEAPLDTVLINIDVTDPSPARAAQIANAAAKQFVEVVKDLETPQGQKASPVKVSVVRPADAPAAPVSPRPKINLALGLLVGLALGVGAAVLRETLDMSVKSLDDVQDVTGASPLGVVIEDPDAARKPLLVHGDSHGPRAEAFRQLRTNLQYVDVDSPPRVVVVTSALPDEGKSTTSVNLASTLAQAGTRVVLLEADLRRPRVARYLGIEGAVGLTDVLAGHCDLDAALQSWGRDLFSVLPSGPLPPNPSEVLSSQHMQDLLKVLEDRFEVVLIDSPPLLPVTDAAVLARAGDGAILVVRHGRTTKEQLARTVSTLQAVDARLLGTVLNRVPRKGPDASYYGYAYTDYDPRPDDSSPKPRGLSILEPLGLSVLEPGDLAASHAADAEATHHGSRHRRDRDPERLPDERADGA